MNFNEMVEAVRDAERTQRIMETQANQLATMLVGKLRLVNRQGYYNDNETLADLKRELTQFNASTGKWKS